MDWNGDGKKDLLVGDSYGKISIFLNTGTNAAPVFSGSTFLQVGGVDYDSGFRAMPAIVDWNNDGKKDVLCGQNAGKIALLTNTGTDAAPVFSSSVFLKDSGSQLNVGDETENRSAPAVADWNGDGKKDLLSGRIDGQVVYYQNLGTDAAPSFSGRSVVQAGGAPLNVGYCSRIRVCDWNNDGQLDVLAGSYYGTVMLYLANDRPTVDAGPEKTICSPDNTAVVSGAVVDEYPAGGALAATWTLASASPTTATVDFNGGATSLTPTVTFSCQGRYTLRLRVADELGLFSTDETVVRVIPEGGWIASVVEGWEWY